MAGRLAIRELRRLKRQLDVEDFAHEFPRPMLLRRRLARTMQPMRGIPTDWTGELGFTTEVIDSPADWRRISGGRLASAKLMPLVKAEDNPFSDRLSVGRAKNCDIVINEGSVSKLHAQFTKVEHSSAVLVELGSRNGTRVNGEPLQKGVPVQVRASDIIIFGGVPTELVDAERLYRLL